jgi:hypothetical protein
MPIVSFQKVGRTDFVQAVKEATASNNLDLLTSLIQGK